ncbi:TetR/AcrR family transcriptional regulator [Melaminivora alkalimesophila]|uniref:TetR family transcriptional regulator n=1 Tax=Melaminivora alkalimesophila TaxID=1165852 RepID=A0A317RI63_9BURK|nr:TetR family transcriptional regulator [Melaminivora alkalimesophila]PWW48776.1 TetR family transcriptional regulator [Melaminivora alkalimesophila]
MQTPKRTLSSSAAEPEPGPAAAASDVPARRPRGRPRKTITEQDDGNRRRKLMDKAAKLFLTKGYAATSTRDIAAAVGMHSGSPYYHFKSKSALLHAVMSEGMTAALESQQEVLDRLGPDAPPHEQLRALVRHHFEILLGPRSGFIPVMLYEWRSLTPAQRRDVARIKDAYEAAWMPALQALAHAGALKAEPAVARLFIFGALNWAVSWFSPRKGLSLDALSEQAMLLFIHHD